MALCASLGIGMPLFRGLIENLGPITGLIVFLPMHIGIVLEISVLFEMAARNGQAERG
jgi:hypothetical protein